MIKTQKPYLHLYKDFNVSNWKTVEKELDKMLNLPITSVKALEKLIYWSNELLDEVEYKDTQYYVLLSTDLSNEKNLNDSNEFKKNILYKSKPYFHKIEQRIFNNEHCKKLDDKFKHYKNILEKNIGLYNDLNLKLQEKEDVLSSEYRKLISNIVIKHKNQELTKAQSIQLLNASSEEEKPYIWSKINKAWLSKKEELDSLFNQILKIRQDIALNCGFEHYGQYLHLSHSRFGYSLESIQTLHDSIEEVLIPQLRTHVESTQDVNTNFRKQPWDEDGHSHLSNHMPFNNTEDLMNKTSKVLENIDAKFAEIFSDIRLKGNIDLEPRKGKSTGGFSFPIDRDGNPFICMNVAGRSKETTILIHEIGHAIHSVFNAPLQIRSCRMFSSNGELAEFPAMILELIAFDYYDEFYNSKEEIKSAQIDHYYNMLFSLRKYITIDKFEHWLYSNPNHTIVERDDYYKSLVDKFNINTDWDDYDAFKSLEWYKSQLIVIMPFYIVSYAIAQLSAVSFYQNYKKNKSKSIAQLKNMLEMGFSKSINELYSVAGVNFDFSKVTVEDTINFISQEINRLKL